MTRGGRSAHPDEQPTDHDRTTIAMPNHPFARRAAAVLLGAALVTATALTGAAPALAEAIDEPQWQSSIDVAPDYLVDAYGLPTDHVFENITFDRFQWLLNGKHDDGTDVSGTFAFLVGNPNDESIRSTIGAINDVAKQYGVETIYTFDPALDGETYNVWDQSALNLSTVGKDAIAALGTRLHSFLNLDTTPAFTKSSTDPYLFIYDRGHTVDVAGTATEDRIVASLNVRTTATDLAVAGATEAYKAQVAAVFDAAAVGGVAQLDTSDQFDYWKNEVNRKHTATYPNAATHGGEILNAADGAEGWRIKAITYAELEHLVQQEGDYAILFGGTWCHNTRAVVKQINTLAQEKNISTIYVFDNSLDSTGNGGSNYLHIRDNAAIAGTPPAPNRASYLYGDLWNTYFPNVATQYRTSASEAWSGSVSPVRFHPGGDTTTAEQLARKGQVPFLFHYNKDNVSGGGTPAPVVSQWIRKNPGSGGWTEYMIDWWWTPTGGSLSINPDQLAFGAEGEAALGTFFDGLPGALEITDVATDAENVGDGTVTLTATVWWCNSIALDAAGRVEFFAVTADGPVSLGSTTSFELGQASISVDDWGLASREYYSVYTPSTGSAYTSATSITQAFAGTAVATTLEASAVLATGSASLRVSLLHATGVATKATGTVAFFETGTPEVLLGTAALANGQAELTVADFVGGDRSFTAVFTPTTNSVFQPATSSTTGFVVANRPTTVAASSTTAPGSSTLTATVSDAGGVATHAAGTVEFFETGTTPVSLGSTPVVSGAASVTVTGGSTAERTFYAVFTAAANTVSAGSTSSNAAFTVGEGLPPEPVDTTLAVTATSAPGSATLTATVSDDSGVATAASGTVQFFVPGAPDVALGSANVVAGVASITVTDLVAGERSVAAVYTAGTGFVGSTSATTVFTLGSLTTTTAVTTAAAPGSATLTATVSSSTAIPAGSVEFFESSTPATSLGVVTVASGTATLPVTDLVTGSRTVFAVYTPASSSIHLGSTSSTATFSIGGISTATAATATLASGSVTLAATVTPGTTVSTPLVGTVEFFRSGAPATALGSSALAAGSASITLTDPQPGAFGFTAVFTPSSNSVYQASTSAAATVSVPLPPVPAPVAQDELPAKETDSDAPGFITGPTTASAGDTVELTLPNQAPGIWVHGYIYSQPVSLGWAQISATNRVSFTIPASLAAGSHTIAVYSADGDVIGTFGIQVSAAQGLTGTGLDVTGPVTIAGLLLIVGLGLGFGIRRLRSAREGADAASA